MSSTIVERLIAAHGGTPFLAAVTKRDVNMALDRIKSRVEAMEDFTQFPEGPAGAILFALLREASDMCPDAGDFNGVYQGYQAALTAAFTLLAAEIDWFPGRG
jgi:hypothetical protein